MTSTLERAPQRAQPRWAAPMLAVLTEERFSSEEWIFDLGGRLARIEQEEPPFAADQLPRRAVHWVRPELVAQIGFTELTGEGKLRHPRFLGLRRDKPAREVVLERPAR
jgi:ATP-dependent DNA ligase